MVVNFVLPTTELYGGVRSVLEISKVLEKRGNEINVVVPVLNGSYEKIAQDGIKNLLKRIYGYDVIKKSKSKFDWFEHDVNVVNIPHMRFGKIAPWLIPDADATVATAWQTAFFVNDLPTSKGKKFYFVQHYETWNGPEEKVKSTYGMPIKIIATSSWLIRKIESKNHEVYGQVLYGVNTKKLYKKKLHGEFTRVGESTRVGMMYSGRKWKGSEDGIRSYEIANECLEEKTDLVLFGKKKGGDVPGHAEFHKDPSQKRLRKIYNSIDIFVMPSHHEGFGMPPMEAMACGTACVVTNVGGVPDYTVPGETAIVVEPRNIDEMADAIKDLIVNKNKRESIANAGHEYIQKFTWEACAEKFESLIQ